MRIGRCGAPSAGMAVTLMVVASFAAALLGTRQVESADADGRYAVRGLGGQSCEMLLPVVDGGAEEARRLIVVLAWLEGYVSASSKLQANTYDSSPLMSPGELAAMVTNVCRSQPDIRIETALARVLNLLEPARVTAESPIVQISVAGASTSLRAETLGRVREKLVELQYLKADAEGVYSREMRAALLRYQQDVGLAPTSLPDADTILRLLLMPDDRTRR